MRIPYPERIPYAWAVLLATLLLGIQLLEHTEPYFAFCCFAYVLTMVTAFNIAGGMYRPAGAYIFFYSLLTLLVGLCMKAFLGEPANSNLSYADRTIEVYLMGMVALLLAAFIESRFRPRHALLTVLFPLTNLRAAYVGCAVLGIGSNIFYLTGPVTDNKLLITFHNIDQFIPFAMILGVIYTVRSTNGRRSITPFLGCLFIFTTAESLLYFSKQALFTPAFCWVIGAAVSRYKLKPINVVSFLILIYLGTSYGVPFVQYGKVFYSEGSLADKIQPVNYMLRHMDEVRKFYKDSSVGDYGKLNYFNQPEGIFDRLEMIGIDDQLIEATDARGFFGFAPIIEGWENLIPHVFWPDKPVPYFGNVYAHEIGILDDNDGSTGISFSAMTDAYHEGGVFGVLFIATLCFIGIFMVFSWVAGDVRGHPAVIILILSLAHLAPEGAMPGAIILILFCYVVIGIGFVCTYVFPVLASLLESPKLADRAARPAFAAD